MGRQSERANQVSKIISELMKEKKVREVSTDIEVNDEYYLIRINLFSNLQHLTNFTKKLEVLYSHVAIMIQDGKVDNPCSQENQYIVEVRRKIE